MYRILGIHGKNITSSEKVAMELPTWRTINDICPDHGFLSFKKQRYEKAN